MMKNRDNSNEMAPQPESPVRMCVICRRRFPKETLIRHVLVQGILTIDAKKNRPGRGWYLCSDPTCTARFAKFRLGTRRKGDKHV